MCGIFGFAGPPARVERISLSDAIRALKHRGPDGDGSYLSPPGDQRRCALVHTRLAILDLTEAGRQPMHSPDGRYVITFNGEIYNFWDVRRELEAMGGTFSSACDTEVILGGYALLGPAILGRLRGMFAFGIWDDHEKKLFLARDRIGVKPLYYTVSDEGFGFASEVRALLKTGVAPSRVSREGLDRFLAFGSVVDPLTLVDGSNSLLPGHYLEYDGHARVSKYWSLPGEATNAPELQEVPVLLSPTIRDSVSLRLISDVPVAVFLSGGFDSSAVAVTSARAKKPEPIRTFTITFDEADYDESRYAGAVAREIGSTHREVLLHGNEIRNDVDASFAAQDQPSHDGFNTYFISRAVRQAGLKVALSGVGGDEVFAGYSSFREFGKYLSAGRWGRPIARSFGSLLERHFASRSVANKWKKALGLLTAGGEARKVYSVLRGVFSGYQADSLVKAAYRLSPDSRRDTGDEFEISTDPVNALSYLEITGYLRQTQLRDIDAMSMAHALEVREPLLDHILIESVFSLPGRYKVRSGRQKPLLVDSVPELARICVDRPKMGFTLPFEVWFRNQLRPWVESTLFGEGAEELPFLDMTEVRRLWTRFLRDGSDVSFSRIQTLVSLVAWCRRHGVTR
ncbi:MAG: asparagine synthase (glutamine-hydrolyzing) [Thermoanaerobaculia bacterium]|nr:asparagine synthase (glutamine-hydrolyzing) [Thermoanaerobaculia bacterium]